MMKETNGQLETDTEDGKPMDKKEGLQLLIYDLKQRPLIAIKIFNFLIFSGYGVLFPFMSIHMRSLGMSLEEIGAIYAVSSVNAILAPLLVGIVADKLGNFKVLLCIAFGSTCLTTLLFTWIPAGKMTTDYPVNMSLVIHCDDHSVNGLVLIDSDSNPCDLKLEKGSDHLAANLSLQNCSCDLIGFGDTDLIFNISSGNDRGFPVVLMDTAGHFQCGTFNSKNPIYYGTNDDALCNANCSVRARRSDLCSNMASQQILNPRLTFWIYLSVRLAFDVFNSGAATLFEGASLGLVHQLRGDYGFQKMFGFAGVAIFSPVSGVLMDHFTVDENSPNFRPAFYLFAGFFAIVAVGMITVDLNFKPPAKELLNDMRSVLNNLELNVLFVMAFISGTLIGCTGNFLFIFLEEIGGSKSLMGLAITVSSLTSIPLLLFSNVIFKNLGHPNVLVVGMAFYVIRLIGYSYLNDPNLCLLLESAEAVTLTLMMTSIVSYGAQLATKTTLASVQGLISAIQYGLGAGVVGSYATSFVIEAYGHRLTFRILGLIALATGFVYSLFNIFYIRRRTVTENNKENPTPTPDIASA